MSSFSPESLPLPPPSPPSSPPPLPPPTPPATISNSTPHAPPIAPIKPSHKGNLPPVSPPPPPSLSLDSISDSLPNQVIIGIATGALAFVVVITVLCVCWGRKRKRKGYESWDDNEKSISPPLPLQKDISYSEPSQNRKIYAHPSENKVVKVYESPSPPPWLASHPPPMPPPQSEYSNSATSGSNFSDVSLPPLATKFAFGFSKNSFTYEELALATDGFSEANLLGQGGFGYVHKGTLLNGKEVAIKQLKAGSGQGEREFRAEVEIISRVHHKHLVSLVGYCISGGRRLLVYEYVKNNTMEFHLHGTDRPIMGWPSRLKIALGSAKGLAYLHEDCNPKIIHRDIKAANILLDYNFEAKVADFGLAKFTSDQNTHVSTRVMGTFGYLAPEYASSGKLTAKSDVFSYGVMLLELITGRQPIDMAVSFDESLVDWARPLMARAMEDDYYGDLVDQRLGRNYSDKEMKRMVGCAAACVHQSSRRRPRMSQVLRVLEGGVSLEDLNEGNQAGHNRMNDSSSSTSSSEYDSQRYNEAMQKLRKIVLESRVHTSSECSEATSEYGLVYSVTSSEGKNTHGFGRNS